MTTDPMTAASNAAWCDGDELMETMAAALWAHCGTENSIITDDPRNIAAVAAAVARAMQPASVPSAPVDRAALRDRIAEVLWPLTDWDGDRLNAERAADLVLAVLPAPVDRAAVLREAADDLATAFGDPMAKHIGHLGAAHLRRRAREIEAGQTTETQPETPLEKRLRYSERRNDELRAECTRRGKRVLEQSEKIIALEKQLDEVRGQLGAEILRAGQAEAALERIQRVVRRLANHAVGFQDVLDDSDRDPWARTVGADIAVLRRMADEEQQPETQLPFIHTDDDSDKLHIGAVMASTYDGEAPVVAVAAEQYDGDDRATVYVRPEHVDEVITALRTARKQADEMTAVVPQPGKEA